MYMTIVHLHLGDARVRVVAAVDALTLKPFFKNKTLLDMCQRHRR